AAHRARRIPRRPRLRHPQLDRSRCTQPDRRGRLLHQRQRPVRSGHHAVLGPRGPRAGLTAPSTSTGKSRSMKKSTAVVLAAAAMLAGTALTTLPAQADLITRCSGTAGPVTVPGDLVVPRAASCTLTGTVVE